MSEFTPLFVIYTANHLKYETSIIHTLVYCCVQH